MRRIFVLIAAVLTVAVAFSQEPPKPVSPENPLSAFVKLAYTQLKTWVARSAEKMPEENYSFKPTDSVRSFGQILGHVADGQYMFCSVLLGEKNPAPKVEQTKTSKAELVVSLKDAFSYCDKSYQGVTDASASQMVKMHGRDMPKLAVLTANNLHVAEHYGNLITYLRLKNIVPPSSEPPGQPQPKK